MSWVLSSDLTDYGEDFCEWKRLNVHKCSVYVLPGICDSVCDCAFVYFHSMYRESEVCMHACACVCVHLIMRVSQWGSKSSRLISSQSPAEQMWGLICQGIGGCAYTLVCLWGRDCLKFNKISVCVDRMCTFHRLCSQGICVSMQICTHTVLQSDVQSVQFVRGSTSVCAQVCLFPCPACHPPPPSSFTVTCISCRHHSVTWLHRFLYIFFPFREYGVLKALEKSWVLTWKKTIWI